MPSRKKRASAICSMCRRVFELIGDSPAAAKQNAETVMRLETAMAKASMTRVERRDPHKLVHKMKVADLSPTRAQL